jgi:hypothetical protein
MRDVSTAAPARNGRKRPDIQFFEHPVLGWRLFQDVATELGEDL